MNIFVTGSSRGLGEAFVEYYLGEKATVYGVGRSMLNRDDYFYKQVDVSDEKVLQDSLEKLFQGLKSLDLIVLNAGILGRIQDTSECQLTQLKKEMDINMWANKTILDFFIKNNIEVKQVIAISSGASVNGSLGWNGYSLSKAALNMLIKLYAAEMKQTHLISLAPGLVKTKMLDSILQGDHDTDKYTSVQSLRNSEEQGLVYSPETIVEKIMDAMPKLLEKESGSFIDIRDLS
jgi:alcohol dehydrogenase